MSSKVCKDTGPYNPTESELEELQKQEVNEKRKKKRRNRKRKRTQPDNQPDNQPDFIVSPEDIPDEYENNENHPGLLLVFNHEEFDSRSKMRKRKGTVKDENNLVDCLSRLGYHVKEDLLCKNYTKNQIEDELNKVVKMDHSKRSSLIVVFLTHGGEDGKLYSSDGKFITCYDLWNFFSADKCPTLRGKPKIFIFQACKGGRASKVDLQVEMDSMLRADIAKKFYTLPVEADILVAYSTFEGNVSFRDPAEGSWYIKELCYNFSTYGRRDDIVTIFTRISKCVAHHYQHKNYKQMPCFISTLTKKFYLCKSRSQQLLETIEKLQKKIEQLEKKDDNNKRKQIKYE